MRKKAKATPQDYYRNKATGLTHAIIGCDTACGAMGRGELVRAAHYRFCSRTPVAKLCEYCRLALEGPKRRDKEQVWRLFNGPKNKHEVFGPYVPKGLPERERAQLAEKARLHFAQSKEQAYLDDRFKAAADEAALDEMWRKRFGD